eukprot:COSAG05_NODE_15031_length_380_cov_0.911032_2_plen_36_part_01
MYAIEQLHATYALLPPGPDSYTPEDFALLEEILVLA